uniref:Uncharacterized protein n=1 Tax=Salix viminalis TaxID=40686 RepID=A0A6N2LSS9_SALVM
MTKLSFLFQNKTWWHHKINGKIGLLSLSHSLKKTQPLSLSLLPKFSLSHLAILIWNLNKSPFLVKLFCTSFFGFSLSCFYWVGL